MLAGPNGIIGKCNGNESDYFIHGPSTVCHIIVQPGNADEFRSNGRCAGPGEFARFRQGYGDMWKRQLPAMGQ
jgi:hypothetical protein